MKTITYWDMILWELDDKYIDRLCEEFDVDLCDIDITRVFELDRFWTALYTNAIIDWIMCILANRIEDEHDRDLLLDSIFTNCIDSHFDVDIEQLHSQPAKDLVINFW